MRCGGVMPETEENVHLALADELYPCLGVYRVHRRCGVVLLIVVSALVALIVAVDIGSHWLANVVDQKVSHHRSKG
jgi:hypothetical protein